jgi:hypothetical protein
MGKKYGLSKISLTLTAFFLTGIALSLLSSFIVVSAGCGYVKILDCGYYAGFPVPYAKFNETALRVKDDKLIVNPSLYYKYKFSPIEYDRQVAKNILADGILMPFFLLDSSLYNVNLLPFILNIIIWLLPAGFLVGVFF